MMILFLKPGEAVPSSRPLRYVTTHGYIGLRWKIGPYTYVECYEHRVVDGCVTTAEHVHHINHVRTDNRPENLRFITAEEHRREHASEHADACVEMYASGLNTTEIAAALGINSATAYRLLQSRGVAFRDRNERRRLVIDEDRLRQLHRQGLSTLQIAREMGNERTVIRRRLARLGLTANGRTYA